MQTPGPSPRNSDSGRHYEEWDLNLCFQLAWEKAMIQMTSFYTQ